MTIAVGDTLPEATLMKLGEKGPEPVELSALTSGRKVVIFGLPGAFTGTCTTAHVPSFIRNMDALKNKGVDEVVCVSVNDPFVMGAWQKADGSKDVTMLADGNGDFAEAVGLTMDGSGFGMGKRSQRYSMLVVDGEVRKLNVEAPGDFSVSSAEHMLGQL